MDFRYVGGTTGIAVIANNLQFVCIKISFVKIKCWPALRSVSLCTVHACLCSHARGVRSVTAMSVRVVGVSASGVLSPASSRGPVKWPSESTRIGGITQNPTESHRIQRNPTESNGIQWNPISRIHGIPPNPRNPTESHGIKRNPMESHRIHRIPPNPRNPMESRRISDDSESRTENRAVADPSGFLHTALACASARRAAASNADS